MVTGDFIGGDDDDRAKPLTPDEKLWQILSDTQRKPTRHEIENLLKLGANPNARTSRGKTAMHLASMFGHVDALRQLHTAGGNIDIADDSGDTCLHIAVQYARLQVVSFILLCEGGKDRVNQQNTVGETALHQLATVSEAEMKWKAEDVTKICAALLEAGADWQIKDKGGYTALLIACENENEQLYNQLTAAGACINPSDEAAEQLLRTMAHALNLRWTRELLQAGVSPNAQDKDGNTAMEYALSRMAQGQNEGLATNCGTMLQEMAAYGARMNDIAVDELSAIAYALTYLVPDEVVATLLNLGATVPEIFKSYNSKPLRLQLDLAALRFESWKEQKPPQVKELHPQDMIFFSNLGVLDQVMIPDLWERHVPHLQHLLSELPPGLTEEIYECYPSITQLLHTRPALWVEQVQPQEPLQAGGIGNQR